MSGDLVIWHLTDEKSGHVTQVRGLLRSLRRQLPDRKVDVHELSIAKLAKNAMGGPFSKAFPAGDGLPDPDLIVAIGRRTHGPALRARRARGGKLIVLMSPQHPLAWFDLCLSPKHDKVAPRDNVIVTTGVLNDIDPASHASDRRGLMLIGGPSKHHGWRDALTVGQIAHVVEHDPQVQWTLTTSRRTPDSFLPALAARCQSDNLTIVPVDQTPMGWVREQLDQSGVVWVTEDSVSMVYESLTAGAKVGILSVPRGWRGRLGMARVVSGVQTLADDGWVTGFETWQEGTPLKHPPEQLREADRCAAIVIDRWLSSDA